MPVYVGQHLTRTYVGSHLLDEYAGQHQTSGAAITGIYQGAFVNGARLQANNGAPSSLDVPFCYPDAEPNGWTIYDTLQDRPLGIVHWGFNGNTLTSGSNFNLTAANQVRARGAISLTGLGLGLTSAVDVLNISANPGSAGAITAAAALDRIFDQILTLGHPTFFRFCHEMNGSWYPYGTAVTGPAGEDWSAFGTTLAQRQSNYKQMWVNAWTRCQQRAAALGKNGTHATGCIDWAWCPNIYIPGGTIPDPTPWFPSGYVDWPAMDGYLFAGDPYRTPAQLFGPTCTILSTLAPGKPQMICEWGVMEDINAPGKAAFFNSVPAWLTTQPQLKAMVYFAWASAPKYANVFIDTSPASLAAYRAMLDDTRFISNVSASFPPDRSVPVPA